MQPSHFTPRMPAVSGPAFRVSEARAAGLSDHACRPPQMHAPTSSVRSLVPIENATDYAAAHALALPDDVVFSHVMAARIWQLPLPAALARDKRVHVMRHSRLPRIERRGCVPHRGLESRNVVEVGGLRVTSLEDTWADLADLAPRVISIDDLVMVGDAVVERLSPTQWIHDEHPYAEPGSSELWADPVTIGCQRLRDVVHTKAGHRGVRPLRAALELIRPRVWSPSESYARLVVVGGQLPEPQLNKRVDHENGNGPIGIVDLHWRHSRFRHKLAGEYQGEGKYNGRNELRSSDNARRLLLEDDGWKVIEIFKRDIFTLPGRTSLVHRIARLLGVA